MEIIGNYKRGATSQVKRKRIKILRSLEGRQQPSLSLSAVMCSPSLLSSVDPDVKRNVVPIIERADCLGAAFLALVVRVDLVVDIGRKSVKAVSSVFLGDEALDRQSLGVLQVHDGIWERRLSLCHYLAGHITALKIGRASCREGVEVDVA